MGFFTKLRNLITGKGWKEDTTEPQPEITPEERIFTQEPTKKPEEPVQKQELPIITEPETLTETEKAEDDATLRIFKKEGTTTDYQELQIQSAEQSKDATNLFKTQIPLSQLHAQASSNINEDYGQSTYFQGEYNGIAYANHLKQAVLDRQITVDDTIAELIVTNADKLRGRFATSIEIWSQGTMVSTIDCPGQLINEIHPEMINDPDLQIGASIGESEQLYETVTNFVTRLRTKGINAHVTKHGIVGKDARIEDLKVKTNFN